MSVNRQLSAILFADIVGYTAMMLDNERDAIQVREKFHSVLSMACDAHNGRVAQKLGDGAFCIFNSSIEAVRAATDVQTEMQLSPVVPLRIGIHSGDVLVEGENIYGNGVNIASRIESLTISGAIFISDTVYDEIKNQKDIDAVSLGKYILKNISEPIGIYAIRKAGLVVPKKQVIEGKGIRYVEKQSSARYLPIMVGSLAVIALLSIVFRQSIFGNDKQESEEAKIIGVIPFANLSASEEDSYFADGICDEVLSQLSKISGLNVISRTSMLQYKGSNKTIREIGKTVGADILLEGSVQKAEDKVRIIVQLIDAETDKHLWAETYDRTFENVFAIQTEIATQIADALHTELTEQESKMMDQLPTRNVQAYDLYLKGNKYAESFWDLSEMRNTDQAIRMYEEAIRLDPNFTAAYHALVGLFSEVYWKKSVINSDRYRDRADAVVNKMQSLDLTDPYTHGAMALYKYKCERDYTGALTELDRMDEMAGNGKSTFAVRAGIYLSMGQIDNALDNTQQLLALFPNTPRLWVETAEIYKLKRDFPSAMQCINKALAISPDVAGFYMNKAIYYAELKGDLDSAYLTLRNAAHLVDTNAFAFTFTYLEILRGNYDRAIRRTQVSSDSLGILWQYKFVPNDLSTALMYSVQGNQSLATEHFQKAYNLTSRLLTNNPDDFRMHAALGIALAGLGDNVHALSEGKQAVALMPAAKDAILGVSSLENLALINTLLGEDDAAIDLLEEMLEMPFAWTMSNSKALYRIHYYWQPLRGNERFEKLTL